MPTFIIVAGGNGSGKTSFAVASGLIANGTPYLNPDMIQRNYGLSEHGAARKMIRFVDQILLKKVGNLAIETTLTGHRSLTIIETAKRLGWEVRLIYLGVATVDIQLARIKHRFETGGHDIAEDDVRRRFIRSFENLEQAMSLCDLVTVFDNSTERPIPLCSVKEGHVIWAVSPLPEWLKPLLPKT